MADLEVLNTLELPWSAGLVLTAAGAMLILFGSAWRDFTEVLVASFLAGVSALLWMPPLAVSPVWASVGACLAAGVLTILFRRVALVVLCAVTVGLALSIAVNLAAGWPAELYQVRSLSDEHVARAVRLPAYVTSQLLLGLLAGGMLLGAILAVATLGWARRVVMALVGSAGFLAGVSLVTERFFAPHLPPGYPMSYAQAAVVIWLELALLSVIMQRRAERAGAVRREPQSQRPEIA
jgi:hypothetical protein